MYWSLTLQIPQAALHSSLVADTWLAWQSMPADMHSANDRDVSSPQIVHICEERALAGVASSKRTRAQTRSASHLKARPAHVQRSMIWFLQIAQLSTTMSDRGASVRRVYGVDVRGVPQAQSATAFHWEVR